MQSPEGSKKSGESIKKKVSEVFIQDNMKVLVFFRDGYPYFSLREFDGKILRAPTTTEQRSLRIQGASEQAIRARITQAILKLKLRPIKANKEEIRYLKKKGVLGKRAPKCSLLTCADMSRLLKSFGCHEDAADLVNAVSKLDCKQGSPIHVIEEPSDSLDKPPKASRSKRSIEKDFPKGFKEERKKKKTKKNPDNLMMKAGLNAMAAHGPYLWPAALPMPGSTPGDMRSPASEDYSRGYPSLSPVVKTPTLPSYLTRESPSSMASPNSHSPASDDSRDSSIPLTPLSAVSQSTFGSPNTERFFFSPIAHKTRVIDHQVYLLSPVQPVQSSAPVCFAKVSQADEAYLAMCSTLQPLG